MDKSVLVMDTPKTCLDCMFCFELDEGIEACCSVSADEEDKSLCKEIICENGYCNNKPEWCPLKELPKEETEMEIFVVSIVVGQQVLIHVCKELMEKSNV